MPAPARLFKVLWGLQGLLVCELVLAVVFTVGVTLAFLMPLNAGHRINLTLETVAVLSAVLLLPPSLAMIAAWGGIVVNLLVSILILVLPFFLESRWNIVLHFRPDFALPLLGIGISLGALGLTKIVMARSK